jgi:glycerophosphoryl diester phosphodiesterase
LKECPKIIGHRANTYRWIRKYLKEGADGVEIDIYKDKDSFKVGHPVEKERPALLRERIARIILGSHILRTVNLPEAARLLKGRILWLDFKDPHIHEQVLSIREVNEYPSQVIITTRFHDEAAEIKKRFPQVKVLLSIESLPPKIPELVREVNADGISLKFSIGAQRPDYIRNLIDSIEVGVWVINDEENIEKAISWGVNYIVTDFVLLAKKTCHKVSL